MSNRSINSTSNSRMGSPLQLRRACEFMRAVCRDLEMPMTATCACLTLFHAYMSASAKHQEMASQDHLKLLKPVECAVENWRLECAACVLIASKANEVSRKVRDVINVMFQLSGQEAKTLEIDESFWKIRDGVIAYEQHILRNIGFNVKPTLPFPFLLNYLKALSAPQPVARTAYAILIETFDLPLCLKHESHVIAAVCIHLACLIHGFNPPTGKSADGSVIRWNHVISVTSGTLEEVGLVVLGYLESLAALHQQYPVAGGEGQQVGKSFEQQHLT
mmetsp:Transcript_35282/g.110251  ORF Transcript_35282/g.110251 Transcript_35282/m.110251 type:complete len:276 (+) Transcript_35282:128-955(+)